MTNSTRTRFDSHEGASNARSLARTPIALFAVLLLLATAQSSLARIGFTREQCDAQYGAAIGEKTNLVDPAKRLDKEWYLINHEVEYKKNGVSIWVHFYDTRKVVDEIGYDITGEVPDALQDSLLKLNAEGGAWSVYVDEKLKTWLKSLKTVYPYAIRRDWHCTSGGVCSLKSTEPLKGAGIYFTSAYYEKMRFEREAHQANGL